MGEEKTGKNRQEKEKEKLADRHQDVEEEEEREQLDSVQLMHSVMQNNRPTILVLKRNIHEGEPQYEDLQNKEEENRPEAIDSQK